jgi:heme-degrading monooxygenase HmoA
MSHKGQNGRSLLYVTVRLTDGRGYDCTLVAGVTSQENSDKYFEYLSNTGLKDYRNVNGNLGVYVLRRVKDARAEFLLISLWDSWDAIRDFAGPDYEKAVYYPEDKDFLLALDPRG